MNGYDVVCCQTCGMAYASGLPTPEEFSSYYTGMSKYESAISSYASSPRIRRAARRSSTWSRPPFRTALSRVLDIGCSTGALLAAFKQRGYTDPEGRGPLRPPARPSLRETHGILVRTGTAADVAALPRRYGLVILECRAGALL